MPGGVCAVLDYDVEPMADYVSEMATRVVMPQRPVNPAFRKFVSQILTSTRLPSTTILLGMNYLAKRINMMRADGQNDHSEGQVWRMFTTALLLASKFLDDNTFQNKSWSEVSGIPVQELNTLEYEWLAAVQWRLYVDLEGNNDYTAWLSNWKEWKEAKRQQQANHDRLASRPSPIEPDIGRSLAQHAFRVDPSPWAYSLASWSQRAPVTPPDSGYGTPEYTNWTPTPVKWVAEWLDGALRASSTTPRHYQQLPPYHAFRPADHPARHAVNYATLYGYGYGNWEHPSDGYNAWEYSSVAASCHCGSCATVHKPPAYFAGHSYGQPAAG
ncbi:hypothetical protein VTK56DRAFT_9803 [Thermocarpiscus australiensis]